MPTHNSKQLTDHYITNCDVMLQHHCTIYPEKLVVGFSTANKLYLSNTVVGKDLWLEVIVRKKLC